MSVKRTLTLYQHLVNEVLPKNISEKEAHIRALNQIRGSNQRRWIHNKAVNCRFVRDSYGSSGFLVARESQSSSGIDFNSLKNLLARCLVEESVPVWSPNLFMVKPGDNNDIVGICPIFFGTIRVKLAMKFFCVNDRGEIALPAPCPGVMSVMAEEDFPNPDIDLHAAIEFDLLAGLGDMRITTYTSSKFDYFATV